MNWVTDGPDTGENQEWIAEIGDTNYYYLIVKYPDGFHLSKVTRIDKRATLEEAQSVASVTDSIAAMDAMELGPMVERDTVYALLREYSTLISHNFLEAPLDEVVNRIMDMCDTDWM